MKHVVITKTYGEIERTKENKHLPDEWPHMCEEFHSLEEALAKHPERQVLTAEEYAHFARGLALAHKIVADMKPKPWWKFWGNK